MTNALKENTRTEKRGRRIGMGSSSGVTNSTDGNGTSLDRPTPVVGVGSTRWMKDGVGHLELVWCDTHLGCQDFGDKLYPHTSVGRDLDAGKL